LNGIDLVCIFPEPVNIPEEKTLFAVMTGLKAVPEKVLSIKEKASVKNRSVNSFFP